MGTGTPSIVLKVTLIVVVRQRSGTTRSREMRTEYEDETLFNFFRKWDKRVWDGGSCGKDTSVCCRQRVVDVLGLLLSLEVDRPS